MKAIVTKYHGATNTRGSRISASDEDGNRVSVSYPYKLSGEACHRKAAQALCDKMNWTGELIGGSLKNGYVFVFTNRGWPDCYRASNRLADLVYATYHPGDAQARLVAPTSTWAEIIAEELRIELPARTVSTDMCFNCGRTGTITFVSNEWVCTGCNWVLDPQPARKLGVS